MSFERLPLALALSVTLSGGTLLLESGKVFASPTLKGRTASYGYKSNAGSNLIIAAKDSGDVSADAPAKGAKDKKDKDGDKDKSKTTKVEKAADKDAGADAKKTAKNSKDPKDSKDQAKEPTKEAKDDGGDKKKAKGGFIFHRHPAEEEKPAAVTAKDEKPAAKVKPAAAEEEGGKTKVEAKAAPAFVPDDALVSVLKDINRALGDAQTEQVQKIENANEKMIVGMAQEILAKALSEPTLTTNRIVPKTDERQVKSALTAESWSSGDVVVNDKLRGSLAAVWAKRIGGLLTVTIAGDAGQRKTADGMPIGEFMVVVTAHSPVQSGFDIQSQADVTYWMGKLNAITVEANCVPSPDTAEATDKAETTSSAAGGSDSNSNSAASSESKKKPITYLSPLLTDRYRKHYAALLAADLDAQKVAAALAAAADPVVGSANAGAESSEPMAGDDSKTIAKAESGGDEKNEKSDGKNASGPNTSTGDGTGGSANNSAAKTANVSGTAGDANNGNGNGNNSNNNNNGQGKTNGNSKPVVIASSNTTGGNTAAASISMAPRYHMPSPSSLLLMPEKALAGQYVTVALLDRSRAPEGNVELSFNGSLFVTDSSGQAVYQIPDDLTPGRSLNIALSSRPDEVPAAIEVLQPLNVTTGLPPRLDRMTPLAIKGSIMTIEGHNFDGIAHNNSVIVDGSLDGHIVSASPFQLKLLLPSGLRPGPHSLCVSTDGMRSNLGGFDFADTVVAVEGKDNGKENCPVKLVVKVIGTTAKMNVKIINQTPDVIRLNRGAEMTITSSGGFDNSIQLPAVRGKKGVFQIDTQIEI